MSEFRICEIVEQEATFDGKWTPPFDMALLMKMINHKGAECEEDLNDMQNPKRFVVRVTIETKEI